MLTWVLEKVAWCALMRKLHIVSFDVMMCMRWFGEGSTSNEMKWEMRKGKDDA